MSLPCTPELLNAHAPLLALRWREDRDRQLETGAEQLAGWLGVDAASVGAFQDLLDPRGRTILRIAMRAAREHEPQIAAIGQVELRQPGGIGRWIEATLELSEVDGVEVCTLIATDVTEREQLRRRIERGDRREALMTRALHSGKQPGLRWNWTRSDGFTLDEAWTALWRPPVDDGTEGLDGLFSGVHPQQAQRVTESLERLAVGLDSTWSERFCVRAVDGTWRRLHAVGGAVAWDDAGVPVEIAGAVRPELSDDGEQGPRPRVLVVEDNRVNQKVIGAMLNNYEVDVEFADSGELAVELAQEIDFDLVLMDLHLTGIDGVEAAVRIRAEAADDLPWIVAMTADSTDASMERMREVGIERRLDKPYGIESLQSLLDELAERLGRAIPIAASNAA